MNIRFITGLLMVLLMACASPQKSFEKGNYEKAYDAALEELEDRDNVRKNKAILNKSFNEMLKKLENDHEKVLATGNIEDMVEVHRRILDLVEKYFDGKRYLDTELEVGILSLEKSNKALADELAQYFWQSGLDEMAVYDRSGDKFSAQNAHLDFVRAEEYGVQYESIDSLIETSYQAGVVHLLVETDSWDPGLKWEIDRRFRDVTRYGNEFLKIHYDNLFSVPDCRLDITFNNLDIGESTNNYSETFSKQILDGYDTVVDSEGNTQKVPRYITVEGQVRTIVRSRRYVWRMRAVARNISNFCDLGNQVFRADETLTLEEYRLSGDLRAIPDRYKNAVRSDFRNYESQVIDRLLDELYRELVSFYF